jgi:hypothetical protein
MGISGLLHFRTYGKIWRTYGENMADIWEFQDFCTFGHMEKFGGHMEKYGGHMGKYGGHMGKYGGHGKLWRTYGDNIADIWETMADIWKNLADIWQPFNYLALGHIGI